SLIMFLRTALSEPPRLADPALDRDHAVDAGGSRLVRGPGLPRRHPVVRQEAHDSRDNPLGPLLARKGAPAGREGLLRAPRTGSPGPGRSARSGPVRGVLDLREAAPAR